MYEVRTYSGVKMFRNKANATKFLNKSGKKSYSALYNAKNKMIKWKSPSKIICDISMKRGLITKRQASILIGKIEKLR